MDIKALAQILNEARKTATPIAPLTRTHADLSLATAYQIQRNGIEFRKSEGEKIIGFKMGLTSKAKMEQMGLHTPIFGVLTAPMMAFTHEPFKLKGLIHPKIEPEIAFKISKDLRGPITREEAWSAVECVYPAMEILDSRFKDFKYFSLPDVVADNSSSSHFILGEEVKVLNKNLDLGSVLVQLLVNDEKIQEAKGSAVLGDPVLSLVELVKLLDENWGIPLSAHSIVLTGAITPAVTLEPGQVVCARFEGLGSAKIKIES